MNGHEFSLIGGLPRGRTVLEASAGTGKTYTIAGLVARYVAEGACELPDLLVVTFTRAATAELRERVRTRLVDASGHLERVLLGACSVPPDGDGVLERLATGDEPTLRERRRRLEAALGDFDAATISTIHGFCQHVLGSLGLAGDVDREAAFVEDQTDLIDAVCTDLLVERFHDGGGEPVPLRDLRRIAGRLVANPDAAVVPAPGETEGRAAVRAELARRIRAELAHRKRRARLLSFDDLLTRLADSLTDPVHGPAACAALRGRYRVALIDEFQDTDPVQWRILSTAFGDDGSTLVLIGDPRQAIYGFRGADVYAYLDAVEAAPEPPRTLSTNWRSDGDLLAAYDALLRGATFGDPRIGYRPVHPAPGHDVPRFEGAPVTAPVRIRLVHRDLGLRAYKGDVKAGAARDLIAADCAAEIVRLLDADATLVDRDRHGRATDRRPLCPHDVAVLARTNAEAGQVQRALAAVGVPAIINGVGSVFASPAATAWRHLLHALERPSWAGAVRAAALTPFLGWTAQAVADADDRALAPLHTRLHGWAAILRDRGVASLLRTISIQEDLPGRVLTRPDGERLLTDLEHLGELLHTAAVAEDLGPTSLLGWLDERLAETDEDSVAPDERARRLESDAEAVQILTIHRAKGLEYPVVAAPFLWSAGRTWEPVPVFHDPEHDHRRTVDVGGRDWSGHEEHHERALEEQRGEDLRLLYVALTRARHQALLWFAPARNSDRSPLARVLFGLRDGDGNVDTSGIGRVTSDARLRAKLADLAEAAGGRLAIEAVPRHPSERRWSRPRPAAAELATATFDRSLDRAWRRTSYSAITAGHDDAAVGSEPEGDVEDDERIAEGVPAVHAAPPASAPTLDEAALRGVRLPLAGMPGGTEVGTLVHAVLEHTDFAARPLRADLDRSLRQQERLRRVDLGDREAVLDGLTRALTTSLGDVTGGRSLADVPRTRRVDELAFELPIDLTGGGRLTVTDVGRLLDDHLDPADPLADYGRRLREPRFRVDLRGYLAGSIDLVLRIDGEDGGPRFVLVDHKTNRLAPAGEELTAWHYRPEALAEAMLRGHYPLQALLYQVALHRYLRWRLRDGAAAYDPRRHLGGVAYLFLRGMVGVTHGDHPCGVFTWQPRTALIEELSDLLDRGRRAA